MIGLAVGAAAVGTGGCAGCAGLVPAFIGAVAAYAPAAGRLETGTCPLGAALGTAAGAEGGPGRDVGWDVEAEATAARVLWCSATTRWMADISTFSASSYCFLSDSGPGIVLRSANPSTRSTADKIRRSAFSFPILGSRVLIMLFLKFPSACTSPGWRD